MKLIDTHCHLAHGRIRQQLEDVLERGRSAGLVAFICAGATLPESTAAMVLAKRFPDVYYTAGVHPHDAKEVGAEYLDRLEELATGEKNVAVGEIGLDYHYNFSPPADQQRVFAEQLDLAKRLGKKIVIHTREAFDDTLAILRDSGVDMQRVVFHSFTRGPADGQKLIDMGATLSFSGIATFSSTKELRQTAAITPDDRILIETDSPYLSPEPVRKMKPNEPANVKHVAECLAAVRSVSVDELAELTTANAQRFFELDISGDQR